jgi:beta-phosphoglucomutase-like phosphatase (HAD superfamily)
MNPSRKPCRGPIQAVIFDWAGTIVDYGSYAPTKVLIEAFAERGVAVSLAEARVPRMGLTLEEVEALPGAERQDRRDAAARRLLGWGAHYVVDPVASLPGVISQIEARLNRGERP